MNGARPEQAELSKDTDMSKTAETRAVIEGMVDGLNDHRIADIGEFFSHGFSWMGNTGCGTKKGLKEFQNNWQKPFQAAFSDKVCIDEARLYMGGQQHLDAKRQFTQEYSWVLKLQEKKYKSDIWTFGKLKMEKLQTIG